MLYSQTYQFLFIHIPKTAGKSIRKALLPYSVKPPQSQYRRLLSHLPVKENPMKANFRPHNTAEWGRLKLSEAVFRNCFKFSFVRNPYDRAVSYYIFLKTNQKHHHHKTVADMSFVEFLRWQQSRSRISMQWNAIADRDENVLVDFIGRFERIETDLQTIFDRLGMNRVELLHKNKGVRTSYQNYYCDVSKKIVESIWRTDIKKLQYKYGD